MKAAAKDTSTAPGALPDFQQVIALSIMKAEDGLRRLIEQRVADEHWDEADVHVDFGVELALAHIGSMKNMVFEKGGKFDYEWFKVAGAVNLGRAVFSRKDCAYFRMLEGACEMFDQLAGLVEFTETVA